MNRDYSYEILKVFYQKMIDSGSTYKCINMDIDAGFVENLHQVSKIKMDLEDLQSEIDKCLANEWIEHAEMGFQYNSLRLTTTGLGLVKSKNRKLEECIKRSYLKRLSDYIEDHSGIFVLFSFIVSFFSLLVAVIALYFSYKNGK